MNEHLSKKFSKDKVKPPAMVWESIEQRIDDKKSRKAGAWWRPVLILLLIPAVGLGGYGIYHLLSGKPAEITAVAPAEKPDINSAPQKNFTNKNKKAEVAEEPGFDRNKPKIKDDLITTGPGKDSKSHSISQTKTEKKKQVVDNAPVVAITYEEQELVATVGSKETDIEEIETEEMESIVVALKDSIAKPQEPVEPIEDDKQVKPWQKRISMAVIYTPESAFRELSPNGPEAGIENHINFRNSIEVARLGGTFGLRVGYSLNQRLNINSGLFISTKGERIAGGNFPTAPTPGNDTFYEVYKVVHSLSITQNSLPPHNLLTAKNNYTYLSLPLELQYVIKGGRLNWYISAGAAFNFMFAANSTLIEQRVIDRPATQSIIVYSFNSTDIQLQGRLGVEYGLNNKISILAEPVIKRSITSALPEDNGLKYFHRSLGVTLGIKWKPYDK